VLKKARWVLKKARRVRKEARWARKEAWWAKGEGESARRKKGRLAAIHPRPKHVRHPRPRPRRTARRNASTGESEKNPHLA